MGTCTAGTGGGSIKASKKIYNEILNQGLNSKINGIREKAINGTGNYSFKGASPVTYQQAQEMVKSTMKSVTRGENTLVDGELPNGKRVYFASTTNSPEIQTLLKKRSSKADTSPGELSNRTTSTYDRWLKNRRRKFDDYYYGR